MSELKPNHTCQICGAKYYACDKCLKSGHWKIYCESPSCYQVYIIIAEYQNELITKDEAIDMFEHIGITTGTLENNKSRFLKEVYEFVKNIII